jgi:hypothetical protein
MLVKKPKFDFLKMIKGKFNREYFQRKKSNKVVETHPYPHAGRFPSRLQNYYCPKPKKRVSTAYYLIFWSDKLLLLPECVGK